MIQFELTIKDSNKELFKLKGREMGEDSITVRDAQSVLMLEQKLEKLFGYRFHIFSEISGDK